MQIILDERACDVGCICNAIAAQSFTTFVQADARYKLPFECMLGQPPGTKARGTPRDIWQTKVYRDFTSLHAQHNWFRIAQDQTGWRQETDCSSTHLAAPAEPV